MKNSTGRVLRVGGFSVLLLMLIVLIPRCILFPNEGYEGDPVDNIRPSVLITGGVYLEEEETESTIHFYWRGADTDGVIRYFEWAIDDTISESAWHQTTANDANIPFLATQIPDGVNFDDPDVDPADDSSRFSDWHTFYVRSVDNDFVRSKPDKRFFNSHTIAPTSQLVNPEIVGTSPQWATTIRMGWEGEDLDGSRADKLPSWFELKLIRPPGGFDPQDVEMIRAAFADSINLLLGNISEGDYPVGSDLFEQARRAWVRVPGTEMSYMLRSLDTGSGGYIFAVRAIDEAGAVEPTFVGGRNWVKFTVKNSPITIRIFESSLGEWEFRSSEWPENQDAEVVWKVTVAPNQNIRFNWVGDASASGTEPGSCNYAIDISDPTDETIQSTDGLYGWIGWAPRTRMQNSISFPPATGDDQIHWLYLKMRDMSDDVATETKCMVRIKVADFSFSKRFLFVDDLRNAPKPYGAGTPEDHTSDIWRIESGEDGFRGVFDHVGEYLTSNQEPGFFNTFEAEGAAYEGNTSVLPDDFLEVLGNYETVIWDFGHNSMNKVGFRIAAAQRTFLSQYIGLGGNLLLYGEHGPVTQLMRPVHGDVEPICPEENLPGHPWNDSSFLWQQLHLRDCIRAPGVVNLTADRSKTLAGCKAVNPLYPDLYIDPDRWGGDPQTRGFHRFETLYTPFPETEADPWYLREDGLELLYRSDLLGGETNPETHNRPIAYRTSMTREDSLNGQLRGRVVCLGVHPYYFYENDVHEAMSLAIDWLVTGSEYTGSEK